MNCLSDYLIGSMCLCDDVRAYDEPLVIDTQGILSSL